MSSVRLFAVVGVLSLCLCPLLECYLFTVDNITVNGGYIYTKSNPKPPTLE